MKHGLSVVLDHTNLGPALPTSITGALNESGKKMKLSFNKLVNNQPLHQITNARDSVVRADVQANTEGGRCLLNDAP